MNVDSLVALCCPVAPFQVLWKGRKCLQVISKCVQSISVEESSTSMLPAIRRD